MKKVKLTQEQADAIEKLKKEHLKQLRKIMNNPEYYDFTALEKPLLELTANEYFDALYNGYEIEPEFKVGDWVKVNWNYEKPTIHKVMKDIGMYGSIKGITIDGEQVNKTPSIEIVEHATPEEIAKEKERRWWKKHGRDVWEVKTGDVLINNSNTPFVVTEISNGRTYFQNGGWEYYEVVEENWKVICFAEDRKDIDHD